MGDKSRPFALNQAPPYYATIFSWLGAVEAQQREGFAAEVFRLAAQTPGFLGAERAHKDQFDAEFGITVFYWTTKHALRVWSAKVAAYMDETYANRDQTRVFRDWAVRIVEVQESLRMGEPAASTVPGQELVTPAARPAPR